jgi:hypothetical protein
VGIVRAIQRVLKSGSEPDFPGPQADSPRR